MDDYLRVARGVLARTEQDLRGLIGRAAAAGEYDALFTLTGWAREVRQLVDNDGHVRAPSRQPADPGKRVAGRRAAKISTARGGRRRKRRKQLASRPAEYPKFLRDGDSLVKIGWSKSEKSTYEHKAPRRVIELLVAALTHGRRAGQRFTMEEALPLKDAQDG